MSWATATCTCEKCGCTFHPRKECYNSRQAADWEDWAAENIKVCGECKAKAEQDERARKTESAREIAEALGYPELKGSEKQIAWALRIREEKADALEEIREKWLRKIETNPEKRERGELVLALIDKIMAHDDAGWWIDRRAQSAKDMIDHMSRILMKEPGRKNP